MTILNEKFIMNPDIIMEKEDDGSLLFNQETGEIKILNITGAFVCERVNGELTGYDIINQVKEYFDCSENEDIEKDVELLLTNMQEASLLVQEVAHV